MVPDIIARFQTTHKRWADLRSDSEDVWQRISPSLQQLTGQTFGEDPKAWARWWDANKAKWPTVSPSSQPASELPKAFKGYELYCWQEHGEFRFTLLPGTNRNKTAEEIFVPVGRKENGWLCISVEGVQSLKKELARLPGGEYVTVMGVKHSMSDELSYSPIPKDLATTLRAEAEKHGLNVQGVP